MVRSTFPPSDEFHHWPACDVPAAAAVAGFLLRTSVDAVGAAAQ